MGGERCELRSGTNPMTGHLDLVVGVISRAGVTRTSGVGNAKIWTGQGLAYRN